ncbi:MAG: hypothetical protein ACOY0T_14260 [Myxococcota bacterium]
MNESSLGRTRRKVVSGVLVLSALVGAYLVWGPSDQRRVLSVLRELLLSASALPNDDERSRRRRVESALARLTLPSLSLSIPELGLLEGHAAILELLDTASGSAFEVNIEQSDVRLARNSADATLLVALTLTALGERRRQVRTVTAELVRHSDGFRVSRLVASAESREQPEARP